MMLNRMLLPCLFIGTIFSSCVSEHESRIDTFNCGTEPDTTIAILHGKIVEQKMLQGNKDTLLPLPGAVISLKGHHDTIAADASGAFTLYLNLKETHPFTIMKNGYQPLTVNGFFAEKETQAEIRIILEKGMTARTGIVTVCKIAY